MASKEDLKSVNTTLRRLITKIKEPPSTCCVDGDECRNCASLTYIFGFLEIIVTPQRGIRIRVNKPPVAWEASPLNKLPILIQEQIVICSLTDNFTVHVPPKVLQKLPILQRTLITIMHACLDNIAPQE